MCSSLQHLILLPLRGEEKDIGRISTWIICVLPDLWRGLKKGGRVFPGPRTSTFTLNVALWPRSLRHPGGPWASSCKTWYTFLTSWQDEWVKRICRGRKSSSCTAWRWQRPFNNSATNKFYSNLNFYLFCFTTPLILWIGKEIRDTLMDACR